MLGCTSCSDATSNVTSTLESTGGDGGRGYVDAMLVVVMGETSGPCVGDPSGKIGGCLGR